MHLIAIYLSTPEIFIFVFEIFSLLHLLKFSYVGITWQAKGPVTAAVDIFWFISLFLQIIWAFLAKIRNTHFKYIFKQEV